MLNPGSWIVLSVEQSWRTASVAGICLTSASAQKPCVIIAFDVVSHVFNLEEKLEAMLDGECCALTAVHSLLCCAVLCCVVLCTNSCHRRGTLPRATRQLLYVKCQCATLAFPCFAFPHLS